MIRALLTLFAVLLLLGFATAFAKESTVWYNPAIEVSDNFGDGYFA